jgi:hypothetical protein
MIIMFEMSGQNGEWQDEKLGSKESSVKLGYNELYGTNNIF